MLNNKKWMFRKYLGMILDSFIVEVVEDELIEIFIDFKDCVLEWDDSVENLFYGEFVMELVKWWSKCRNVSIFGEKV